MRLDILLGAVTTLMAVLGGIVAVWPPKTRLREIIYVASFIVFGITSMISMIKQSNQTARTQKGREEKADREQKELHGKLDQSLVSEEIMKTRLADFTTILGKFAESNQNPDIKQLAAAIAKFASGLTPRILSATIPVAPSADGPFQVPHKLPCTPAWADIQMTSGGNMWFQKPKYDDRNLYLIPSAGGISADIFIACNP